MKPFYKDAEITLYNGDALDILPDLKPVDVIYCDPVWPDCEKIFPGVDANAVFQSSAEHFPRLAGRVMVHLACDTDPRFLRHIPAHLEFFRICWLRFVPARYRGTLLAGADCLYIFGSRHLTGPGSRVIPGETIGISKGVDSARQFREWSTHPCPRQIQHVRWIIENWTRPGDTILDPFAGSGRFLIEAARAGRKAIGIEINPTWCSEFVSKMQDGLFGEKGGPHAGAAV